MAGEMAAVMESACQYVAFDSGRPSQVGLCNDIVGKARF